MAAGTGRGSGLENRGSIRIGLVELLLMFVLIALLAVLHEAIHGLVMLAFGARPTLGAVLVAGVMPALYATSVGHRFSRQQYFVVAAAHLGGCVGDGAALLRLLREPPGTLCEDLKDGIRFFAPNP